MSGPAQFRAEYLVVVVALGVKQADWVSGFVDVQLFTVADLSVVLAVAADAHVGVVATANADLDPAVTVHHDGPVA